MRIRTRDYTVYDFYLMDDFHIPALMEEFDCNFYNIFHHPLHHILYQHSKHTPDRIF